MTTLTALQIGSELESITLNPVTRLDLIKYAGASGDYNPIHTIDQEAENAGLPGIIAHGMWTMGNLSKLFTPYVAEGFIEDYSIRFKGMVFLGDVLTLKARLVEEKEKALTFDVMVLNQHEKEVVKGKIKFSLI